MEHARHHGVRRRRGHRRGGLLLNHDEVPVARGWMRVREGGRRGDEGRGRSPDGGRADGQDVRRGRGLRARTSRAAAVRTRVTRQVSVWILAANAARRRNELERTHQAHARQERHEKRRPRTRPGQTRVSFPPPGAKDPRGGHRGGQARGETRLATGRGGARLRGSNGCQRDGPRFESARPRTLAAARRGRHRHRGVARGPGRHVSDVRVAVGRRGVRPELRRRAFAT